MVTRSGNSRSPDTGPRDAARSRALIVTKATEFLAHHPYRELNAGVLMEATGLSRPAFYQYFRNIPALIAHLLEGLQAEMRVSADDWLLQDGDRIPALRTAFTGIATIVKRHGMLFRAIVEAAPADANLEGVWNAFMQEWIDGVAARIHHEQTVGLIDPALDPAWISKALNTMDVHLLVDSFGRPEQEPLESVVETIVSVWSRTLYATDK